MGKNELNISIVNIQNNSFKIISAIQENFGGDDFDNELVKFYIESLKENEGFNIENDLKLMKQLRKEYGKAKIGLFENDEEIIEIKNFF